MDEIRAALDEISRQHKITFRYAVDRAEAEYFESIPDLASNGLTFMLCDDEQSQDLTSTWSDTMKVARALISDQVVETSAITFADFRLIAFRESYFTEMRQTRLGGCISAIVQDMEFEHGGIWFADGGPDNEAFRPASQCEKEILKTLVLAWDCLPNTTFVW
jgi:hypothetical protein